MGRRAKAVKARPSPTPQGDGGGTRSRRNGCLKLILAVQLMCAIEHKRGKQRDNVKEDTGYAFDDRVRLLMLVEYVAQPGVDSDDIVNVPKHLLDKVCPTVFRDDIRCVEGSDSAAQAATGT